jgi:hypothetical protein
VSFDVVDKLQTIILRPADLDKGKHMEEGSAVGVYYGRKLWPATVVKNRGHEKFDVRYAVDNKIEAGVDVSRIMPGNFAFRMVTFGRAVYPFMCVPLKNRDKALGVLGIDSMGGVAIADHEQHPDADFVSFVERVGRVLGVNIDSQMKKTSMQMLHNISKNQFAQEMDVFEATFKVLMTNITHVTGMVAVRIDKKMRVLLQQGVVGKDITRKMAAFNPVKSSLKAVQMYGRRIVWLLCRLRPATRGEQGKMFIVGAVGSQNISEPDHEFLYTVQKVRLFICI